MRFLFAVAGVLLLLPVATAHDLSSGWTSYLLGDGRLSAGTAAGPSGTAPTVAWNQTFQVGTADPDWGSPLIADGTVYFGLQDTSAGSGRGWLHAYDLKDGTERWKTQLQNSIGATPALDGATLYVVANDDKGRLHALDTGTGASKWNFLLDLQSSESAPLVSGGLVYLASQKGSVYAIDPATQVSKWKAGDASAIPRENAVALWNGMVFLATVSGPAQPGGAAGCSQPCSNDYVYAFDQATGALRWRTDPTEPTSTDDDLITTPVAVDGRVYVSSDSIPAYESQGVSHAAIPARLFALDATTGSVLWKKEASVNWREPAVVDGLLIVADQAGNVQVLDAKSGATNCARCWSKKFDSAVATPVAVSYDTLYFGTFERAPCVVGTTTLQAPSRGFLYAVSLSGGNQLWRLDLGSRIPSAALAVGQGFVAFTAHTLDPVQCASMTTVQLIAVGSNPGPHPANAAPTLSDFVPPDGLAGIAPGGSLKWTGKDADAGDSLRYDVYFGSADPPPLVARLQRAEEYKPTLVTGSKYYWRVVAVDAHGARAEGPTLSFSTAGTAAGSPPVAADGSTTPPGAAPPQRSKGFLPGPEPLVLVAALAAALRMRRR